MQITFKMDNVLAVFPKNEAFVRGGSFLKIPRLGVSNMEEFLTGYAMLSPRPGDIFVGVPYWDLGEIR